MKLDDEETDTWPGQLAFFQLCWKLEHKEKNVLDEVNSWVVSPLILLRH